MLAGSDTVATLIFSRTPLEGKRLAALKAASARLGHTVLLMPGQTPVSLHFLTIVQSTPMEDLAAVVASGQLDLSPPIDNRPFFFNQLCFSTTFKIILGAVDAARFELKAGVINGNLDARKTLLLICF